MTFLSSLAFSQMYKTMIYSTINVVGDVDYLGFDKLLPDSLNNKIIVNYDKIYKINKAKSAKNFVLAQMILNDWKLVSAAEDDNAPFYTLSKKIFLDDAAYKLYVDKLNNEVPKR